MALGPLLKVCHAGAAVLILGNVTRDGAHSRLNGVVEDRADFVFEVRDATNLQPSGKSSWVEELAAQGAKDWQARNSRRAGKTRLRFALVPTKVREGPELEARVKQIDFVANPWTVTDVTAELDQAGENAREDKATQNAARYAKGIALLTHEIQRRHDQGAVPILKTAAVEFLFEAQYKRAEGRLIVEDSAFVQIPVPGTARSVMLKLKSAGASAASAAAEKPHYTNGSAANDHPSQNPNNDDGFEAPRVCRPHVEHTANQAPSETSMDKGDSEKAASAAEIPIKHRNGSFAESGKCPNSTPSGKPYRAVGIPPRTTPDDGEGMVI